jgi:6-pyruvoyltetrahydropterin/6-carboxytetrahydropterin synthase
MRANSKRWVSLPVSPTAEQLTRVIFFAVQAMLDNTVKTNGDESARVHSVILHETETGYAQCFRSDAYDAQMGEIHLKDIVFSPQVKAEWSDPKMWDKLLKGVKSVNPRIRDQIDAPSEVRAR